VDASARIEGADGVITVTNAGEWAPPEDGDFSAFFQGDMSATRTKGGFGLGLFIVSRLCQACDGGLTYRVSGGRTIAEARFRLRPTAPTLA